MIREQPAAGVLEGELLKLAAVAIEKRAARLGANPDVSTFVGPNRGDCSSARANLLRSHQVVDVVEAAVLGGGFSANPRMSAGVSFDGLNEERARSAEHFLDEI